MVHHVSALRRAQGTERSSARPHHPAPPARVETRGDAPALRWWPVVVLASLPAIAVLVSAMVAAGRDPIADSDAAVTEIWVRTALDGDALVGPYSRFGWHHPGPTWFYLAAPLYLAFGRGVGGLAVAAAAVMVASTVLAVWIVGHVEGGAGAWVVGLTLLGWTVTVGTTWFDNFWNPLVAIGPCLVVGIAAAALAAGRGWCLPLVVGFGSLAIQTHIGSAPAVVGMAAPAMIALALGGWRSVGRRPAGLAILTLAVLWVLPLWEQLTSSPGNVTELIKFARTSGGAHAVADIAPQLGPQLTLLHVDLIEDSIGPGFDADAGWWTVGLGAFIVGSRRPRLRQPPPTTAIRSGALRGGVHCGRLDDVELPPHRRSCLRLPLRVGRGGGRSGVVRDLAHGRPGALRPMDGGRSRAAPPNTSSPLS